MAKAPVLKFYDASEELTIECDAGQHRLGAALLQNGQPIAFASRSMTSSDKRYAQIEKDC